MFEKMSELILLNATKIIELFAILDMIPTVFEEITKHITVNRDGLNEQGEVIKENRDEILRMQKIIGGLLRKVNSLEHKAASDYANQVGG